MIPVWDPFVRAFHWALAASFAVAWASSEHAETVHDAAGYVAGALVAVRVVWGFVGPRYARFAQFVRSPETVIDYVQAIGNGSERRYIGHNPAGGAMIVVLLAAVAATAFTGWMMTTDAFWGSEALQHVHSVLAHAALALVALHLAGVALASLRHRENLVRAMVVGAKRPAAPGDVG
ncbi:cytochrome b [Roseiarcus fermentans]|uniref:Cytochrome b n=1 Tax=Roseiarcus fermentans TaxID=1473586 RepID=A0A366FI98_9HYPH|nr:cytochrome b/b6 domain-containing protein [Roseiarcus fermentans]RBP14394.1 cytochrome b [Roseiarcus fermentans]